MKYNCAIFNFFTGTKKRNNTTQTNSVETRCHAFKASRHRIITSTKRTTFEEKKENIFTRF